MDKFKYVVNIKQIDNCKYVKDIEQLVRLYEEKSREIKNDWKFNYRVEEVGVEPLINTYKCYRASLNKFEQLSNKILPDFIYNNVRTFHKTIIKYIVTNTELFDYSKIMNIFEFDKVLNMPSSRVSEEYLLTFSKLIGDNPVHFERVEWNDDLNTFNAYSLGYFSSDSKLLVKAIRHKQTTLDNKPNTLWDWYINELKSKFNQSLQDIEYNVTKLQNQINALNTVKELHNEQS